MKIKELEKWLDMIDDLGHAIEKEEFKDPDDGAKYRVYTIDMDYIVQVKNSRVLSPKKLPG